MVRKSNVLERGREELDVAEVGPLSAGSVRNKKNRQEMQRTLRHVMSRDLTPRNARKDYDETARWGCGGGGVPLSSLVAGPENSGY